MPRVARSTVNTSRGRPTSSDLQNTSSDGARTMPATSSSSGIAQQRREVVPSDDNEDEGMDDDANRVARPALCLSLLRFDTHADALLAFFLHSSPSKPPPFLSFPVPECQMSDAAISSQVEFRYGRREPVDGLAADRYAGTSQPR